MTQKSKTENRFTFSGVLWTNLQVILAVKGNEASAHMYVALTHFLIGYDAIFT